MLLITFASAALVSVALFEIAALVALTVRYFQLKRQLDAFC